MAFHEGWGRTVLFGSSSSDFKTWVWDGVQWAALPVSNSFVPSDACAAYDSLHGRMILFGGSSSDNATRELGTNGVWAVLPISATVAPPPRSAAAMAYDSDRARIILFGGIASTTVRADVWEFDGAGVGSWTARGIGPGARHYAAMTYDPVRHRVVLQGGIPSYQGQALSSTYEYDPAQQLWTLRADDGPAWRDSACMVTDTARSAVLLFGGWSGGGTTVGAVRNDTWRFDGAHLGGTVVVQAPQNLTVALGQPASLSIVVNAALGYQWYRNSVPLSDGGTVSGSQSPTLSISAAARVDSASYAVVVHGSCGDISRIGYITVEDPNCYLNCDHSTAPPILNAIDFQCFINKFAAGDSYANCDSSTTPPILNANDFSCYINQYAAGCR